tara:strand:+ start:826 stop:2511 length:1686 start_codon:yes stop_codon:yes gene_type:complete
LSTLSDTFKTLGPARLAVMGTVLFGIILFFIFLTARMSSSDMALLYANLDPSDSGAIAAKLEEFNIPYEVSPDGSSVTVPDSDVGRARMFLAEEGLPGSATVGYEIFDKQNSFGTTDFVQNINQIRALEGELSKTVSTLKPIQKARIHLVLPKRQLFSRDSQPATASVFVKLRSGESLSPEQIAAIQHMAAASVPQLKPTRVSVVDENGNLLARGVDESDEEGTSVFQRTSKDAKLQYESRMSRVIEELVGEIVGYQKVRANVTADMNFDRIQMNSEIYDPEGQVVRSTQLIEETDEDVATRGGGNQNAVTVQNNLPGLNAGPAGFGGGAGSGVPKNTSSRIEEITNFEITKTIKNHVRESGEITKMSVAVLIDGTYVLNEEGKKVYQPRSEEEIEQIESIVRSAVGFDPNRGDSIEVLNMRFAAGDVEPEDILEDTTIMGFERADLLDIAETVTLAIVALLVVVLVLQPLVNKLIEQAANIGGSLEDELENLIASQVEKKPQLAGPKGGAAEEEEQEDLIDMEKVKGRVKASTVEKVNELVTKHPTETVSVLRNWMYQEN